MSCICLLIHYIISVCITASYLGTRGVQLSRDSVCLRGIGTGGGDCGLSAGFGVELPDFRLTGLAGTGGGGAGDAEVGVAGELVLDLSGCKMLSENPGGGTLRGGGTTGAPRFTIGAVATGARTGAGLTFSLTSINSPSLALNWLYSFL